MSKISFKELVINKTHLITIKENDKVVGAGNYLVEGNNVKISEMVSNKPYFSIRMIDHIMENHSDKMISGEMVESIINDYTLAKYLMEGKEEYLLQNKKIVDRFNKVLWDRYSERTDGKLSDDDDVHTFANLSEERRKEIALRRWKEFTNNRPMVAKFLPWIVKQFCDGYVREDDMSKLDKELALFVKFQHQLEKKDLNQYSYEEFSNLALELSNMKTKGDQTRLDKEGAEKVFEDNRWVLLRIDTMEAAIYYGKGTRWCTAATGSWNYFDHYHNQGNIYILINKKNPSDKFQFHWETSSFMNPADNPISDTDKDRILLDEELTDYLRHLSNSSLASYIDALKDENGNLHFRIPLEEFKNHYYDGARNSVSWATFENMMIFTTFDDWYDDSSISDLSDYANKWEIQRHTINDFFNMLDRYGIPVPSDMDTKEDIFFKLMKDDDSVSNGYEVFLDNDIFLVNEWVRAMDTGIRLGAENMAYESFSSALLEYVGEKYKPELDIQDDNMFVEFTVPITDYESSNEIFPELDVEINNKYDIFFVLIKNCDELKVTSPYFGWDEFDKDEFNYYIQDSVIGEIEHTMEEFGVEKIKEAITPFTESSDIVSESFSFVASDVKPFRCKKNIFNKVFNKLDV